MSTAATEIAVFIQQFVQQQQCCQGACVTGKKGHYSVDSGARHHCIIGGLSLTLMTRQSRWILQKDCTVKLWLHWISVCLMPWDLHRVHGLSSATKTQVIESTNAVRLNETMQCMRSANPGCQSLVQGTASCSCCVTCSNSVVSVPARLASDDTVL